MFLIGLGDWTWLRKESLFVILLEIYKIEKQREQDSKQTKQKNKIFKDMGQLQNTQYIYNGNNRRKKRERNRRHIEAMSENHRSRISQNTKQDKYPPPHTKKTNKSKQALHIGILFHATENER